MLDIFSVKSVMFQKYKKKQAGAELCQAQAQVDLPAELILQVGFQIRTTLDKSMSRLVISSY